MQVTAGATGSAAFVDITKSLWAVPPAGMAELLVAEFEGKPLRALMIFAIGQRSWYLYGASNDEERNVCDYLLAMKPVLGQEPRLHGIRLWASRRRRGRRSKPSSNRAMRACGRSTVKRRLRREVKRAKSGAWIECICPGCISCICGGWGKVRVKA